MTRPFGHWHIDLSKILGGGKPKYGVVMTDANMGVSQLLGVRALAAPLKVYAYGHGIE